MDQKSTITETSHAEHPTAAQYFKVAMILTVITAIEVGIFYLEFLGIWIIPILFILSAGKFALVAMYYMQVGVKLFKYGTLAITTKKKQNDLKD